MQVSLPALVTVLERAGLGEPHAVLAGAERYVSRRVRHRVDQQVWDELNRAGLADGDRPGEDLLTTLTTIQRAGTEYFGWIIGADGSRGVVAAAAGPDAALLARSGNTVWLDRVRPDTLLPAFVGQLPEVPPARAMAISVRSEDLGPHRRPGYLVGVGSGPADPGARKLAALLREPRTGGGKFYAAHRDRTGKRSRSRRWLTVVDVPAGRWLVYAGEDGSVTAVPGTPQRLVGTLSQLD